MCVDLCQQRVTCACAHILNIIRMNSSYICMHSGPSLFCRVHSSILTSHESSLSVSGCWVWSAQSGRMFRHEQTSNLDQTDRHARVEEWTDKQANNTYLISSLQKAIMWRNTFLIILVFSYSIHTALSPSSTQSFCSWSFITSLTLSFLLVYLLSQFL